MSESLLEREPADHAVALLKWLWAEGFKGRVWAKDIEAAYPRMCAAHRWHVHKWNQTGKHFRELLGCGIKYGNHIDDGGVKHRWCYYPLPPPQALNGLLSRLAHDDGAGAPERAAA